MGVGMMLGALKHTSWPGSAQPGQQGCVRGGVDGRDKPGHDGWLRVRLAESAPMEASPATTDVFAWFADAAPDEEGTGA